MTPIRARLRTGMAVAAVLAAAAAGVYGATAPAASAAGILPPAYPPSNIPASPPDPGNVCPGNVAAASRSLPCIELQVEQIDNARAREGVGPMKLPADYASLTPAEQLFEVIGQERVDRGLNAPVGMYSTYDQNAMIGAEQDSDPPLSDGALTSIWSGGYADATALAADYGFMYDDGPGSGNGSCSPSNPSGCWIHREAILDSAYGLGQGYYVGAAYAPNTRFPASYALEAHAQPSGTLQFAFQPGTVVPPRPSICNQVLGGGVVGMAQTADGNGYWIASADGQVSACGDAPVLGHAPAATSNPGTAIAAIASTPDGGGFWEVTAAGTVYPFGDAAFHGDLAGTRLNGAIVAMTADPATGGYWLLGSDGGVFSFDAPFHGSTGGTHLAAPTVGMAATASGGGYYLVASDGGVFAFGHAPFHGSVPGVLAPGQHLARPVVGMALDPATGGYWMDAADGGIFSFDAPFHGSAGGIRLNYPCVGMTSLPDGTGYRFVAGDGGIFDFGRAAFVGSAA